MAKQSESGLSLKDDIASIWKDPTYHDVIIVCADGVELGACRAILASRFVDFGFVVFHIFSTHLISYVLLKDARSSRQCCMETCKRVLLIVSSSMTSPQRCSTSFSDSFTPKPSTTLLAFPPRLGYIVQQVFSFSRSS